MRAPLVRAGIALGAAGFAAAAGAHVWARHVEIHQYRVRHVAVPALPAAAAPVRLLHISDIHLMPDDHRKLAFLRSLSELEPDVVVDTGDNISDARSIAPLGEAIAPLLATPGAFVLGSNDMYAPKPKNPLRYFLKDPRPASLLSSPPPMSLPTPTLVSLLGSQGWEDLTNTTASTDLPGVRIEWSGVDDPHLERDDAPESFTGAAGDGARRTEDGRPILRVGVAHAPYRRVLDSFADLGSDLILAGHTHGGQLRVPGFGALVTNCDLPRRQAKGLSAWRGVPLHVSGGMGASPYTNYRFANPPEATLLTLVPRSA